MSRFRLRKGVGSAVRSCEGGSIRFVDSAPDAWEVTFMDSTGGHALVSGKRLIHENETKIILFTSPQVRRMLELVFPEPLSAARFDTVDALRALDEGRQAEGGLPLDPGTRVIAVVLTFESVGPYLATGSVVA